MVSAPFGTISWVFNFVLPCCLGGLIYTALIYLPPIRAAMGGQNPLCLHWLVAGVLGADPISYIWSNS